MGDKGNDDAFEKQLAALRRAYVAHLPVRRDQLAALSAAIARNPAANAARKKIAKIHELTHNLSGSGGSYGAAEIGPAAAQVERACEAILSSGNAASTAQWREVERLLGRLQTAIDDFIRKEGG